MSGARGGKAGRYRLRASFWTYPFPAARSPTATVDGVVDLVQDFGAGLGENLAV